MIREAIERIIELSDEARSASILTVPGQPKHIQHIQHHDGSIEKIVLEPEPKNITLNTVEDLIYLVNNPVVDTSIGQQIIFVDIGGVKLIMNSNDGRDTAYLNLNQHPEHKWLEGLYHTGYEESNFSPADLMNALRYTMCASKPKDAIDKLIEQISKMSWISAGDGHVQVSRTGESLGQSVTKQVKTDTTMPPELVTFRPHFWKNSGLSEFQADVECHLDPNHESHQWRILPTHRSWIDATNAAINYLVERLSQNIESSNVLILRGSWPASKQV